jgi:hypothetical protein
MLLHNGKTHAVYILIAADCRIDMSVATPFLIGWSNRALAFTSMYRRW